MFVIPALLFTKKPEFVVVFTLSILTTVLFGKTAIFVLVYDPPAGFGPVTKKPKASLKPALTQLVYSSDPKTKTRLMLLQAGITSNSNMQRSLILAPPMTEAICGSEKLLNELHQEKSSLTFVPAKPISDAFPVVITIPFVIPIPELAPLLKVP